MTKHHNIAGAVLAGGRSRRMGTDKRYVSIHGRSLLDGVLSVLLDVFSEVLLVLAKEDVPRPDDRVNMVTDLVPGCAALGGVYTALHHARCPRTFVVACDMPFLDQAVIEGFLKEAPDADVVLAQLSHGPEPLHAVYSKHCLPLLKTMIEARDFCLQHLPDAQGITVHRVAESTMTALDPHLRSFLNVNSPADVAFARTLGPVSRS